MKQYKSFEELINTLINEKNINASTIKPVCFLERNFIDLVTPYSDLLAEGRDSETNKHIYPKNIDFNDYLIFNKIDSEISKCLHILISCFEKQFKTFLIDTYCQKMKNLGDVETKDFSWCKKYIHSQTIFDLVPYRKTHSNGILVQANSDTIKRRKSLLEKLQCLSKKQSTNFMVAHYQIKYKFVPMYIAIHTLTFGELNTLFSMLPQSDQIRFMQLFFSNPKKIYSPIEIDKFQNKVTRIQIIRNIVNHYEPITPFILNTNDNEVYSLTSLLKELKTNYKCSLSFNTYEFNPPQKPNSKSKYSMPFHKKLWKVIDSLK